jgi:hypothetical protein
MVTVTRTAAMVVSDPLVIEVDHVVGALVAL